MQNPREKNRCYVKTNCSSIEVEYFNTLQKAASLTFWCTSGKIKREKKGSNPCPARIKYIPAHKAFHKELHQGTTSLLCCHRAAF